MASPETTEFGLVRPRRNEDQVTWRSSADRTVIMLEHKVFVLKQDETLVWNLCDGSRSVADIEQELCRKVTRVPPETIHRQLHIFLQNMADKGLMFLESNDRTHA